MTAWHFVKDKKRKQQERKARKLEQRKEEAEAPTNAESVEDIPF